MPHKGVVHLKGCSLTSFDWMMNMNVVAKPLERFVTNSLEQHWMPFSANRDFKSAPRLVTKSEGMYLWNQNGDRLIDGCSGLFNVAAGHGRREIAEAVYAQMLQNDYTSPFQTGQPASFALAAKLANILPEPFNHVFFTNSGSESIDTALKMVMAYHRARGDGQRIRFVSRERAYHGVNMGGVSLAGMVKNRETFPVVMPNIVMLRHTWNQDELFVKGQPENGAELANDCSAIAKPMAGGPSPLSSLNRSPARPVRWPRRKAIWNGCARFATSTAFCWCLMKSSPGLAGWARRSLQTGSA